MKNLVAIDVGHIGKPSSLRDKGANYKKVNEADLVMLYAALARGWLEKEGIPTVFLSYGNYGERHQFCKRVGVDLHLQCHLNAAKGKYGLIGYRANYAGICEPVADIFAKEFRDTLNLTAVKKLPLLKNDRRRVCTVAGIPSLLLEPLFLDNPQHFDYLINGDGIDDIAEAITISVLTYLGD
jgi:N-acetylmuramoyl-L-alanine amidase